MLRALSKKRCGTCAFQNHSSTFHTSLKNSATPQPQSSELDDSYKQLLEDVNFSYKMLRRHSTAQLDGHQSAEESSELPAPEFALMQTEPGISEPYKSPQWKRKSAAARLGSDRIGQYKLPFELVTSTQMLIDENDKHQLRSDAKRILSRPTERGQRWIADAPQFGNKKEERLRGTREGLAYAAVTLPRQVAAITSVLHELETRLPKSWDIKNVLDFGSQTGAGFWSTLTFFGSPREGWEHQETLIEETDLKRYIGFDSRKVLVDVAKRIERDKHTGGCTVIHKEFWRDMDDHDKAPLMNERANTLAISAFVLSQLPTPASRKQMVKEMWKSGADYLIVMDQGTKDGFHAVADAREYLIRIGGKDPEGRGAHVVAPCPHDGVCPLRATPDVCAFPQRFIRPEFQKRTKHTKEPYENVSFSYVVIARGKRPNLPATTAIESIRPGVEEQVDEDMKPSSEAEEQDPSGVELVHPELLGVDGSNENPSPGESLAMETERQAAEMLYRSEAADGALQETLREGSYHWRRVIYPPMKGSGHVTLDTCTPRGQIARIVIPRSQGKQDYYDARKASWGDLFPHEPRNGEVIRTRGIKRLEAVPSSQGTEEVLDEDEERAMQKVLNAAGAGDAFGERNAKGRPRRNKSERREQHRKRKEWRREESEDL